MELSRSPGDQRLLLFQKNGRVNLIDTVSLREISLRTIDRNPGVVATSRIHSYTTEYVDIR